MNKALRWRASWLVCGFILLQGCAVTSMFQSYPSQATGYKNSLASGVAADALKALNGRRDKSDKVLYMMERGRIAQLEGDFAGSQIDFNLVIKQFEEQDKKALISLTSGGSQISALFVNDNAIPYAGEGFERIFVHTYQAFNYLGQMQIEAATVELRRANLEQERLEATHAKAIAQAENKAVRKNISLSQFDARFPGMSEAAGRVKSSFQNAYTFYVSAIIWESLGELNDALVDYKRALEINPHNEILQADVGRVSRKLGITTDYKADKIPVNSGALVVLFEDGFVPLKRSFNLPIGTRGGGIFSISFPYYDSMDLQPIDPLVVRGADGKKIGKTKVIADVGAMAVKALKEKIPGMLVRQVLRARAKYELQRQALKEGNGLGQFAASIYNIVSEQADLRNWSTLPNNTQIIRTNLSPGNQLIRLSTAALSANVDVPIRANKTTILRVTKVRNRVIPQIFAL